MMWCVTWRNGAEPKLDLQHIGVLNGKNEGLQQNGEHYTKESVCIPEIFCVFSTAHCKKFKAEVGNVSIFILYLKIYMVPV